MADGSVKIIIEVDGREVKVASDELNNLGEAGHRSGKGVKSAEDGMSSLDSKSGKASISIKDLAISLGLVKIASAAFNVLKQSLDGAIGRFDTLNKFPVVLQSLGVSAEDSQLAIDKLANGLEGTTGYLQDVASNAQRMYTSLQDIDKATDSALALQRAFDASAATTDEAKRGTEQYIKALQTGKMDMNMWNTLQTTMGIGLNKIAEGFNMTEQELYKALQSGMISMDDFNDKMIELGTGTGILVGMAKENSLGIANALEFLKASAVKGIADIIDSFNRLSIAVTGKGIAEHIESLRHVVDAAFNAMGAAVEATAPIFILFGDAVKGVIPVVDALTPLIIGLITAYAAHAVITKAQAAIEKSNSVLKTTIAVTKTETLLKQKQTIAQILGTKATTADIVAKTAHLTSLKLSTLAVGVFTGAISAKTAVQIIATKVTYGLAAAIKFLSGPIGWVVAGLGLLVAGAVALVKWFKRSTEEGDALKEKTNELGESVETSVDKIEQSSSAYKEQTDQMEINAKAQEDLMQQIVELSEKEEKSAADKQLLSDKIAQLNGEVEGLGLAYNEEADSLNLSNEQMEARIGLQEDQSKYTDANERLLEISKEQIEVDMKMKETNKLMKENQELYDEGAITKAEYDKVVEGLTESEDALKAKHKELGEEYVIVEGQVIDSMDGMIEAMESGAISQSEMVDTFVSKNEELVSDMRSAYEEIYGITTDAFDRINDKSKLSAEEMIENLKHNQEMMANWGENISELMGYASQNGHENFLHWLETLGPDSAAEVAVISDMSDKELAEFATTMEKGADVSTKAFNDSLGEGMEGTAEQLGDHITGLSETMQSAARDAGFEDIGKSIVEGYAGSITDNAPKAEEATKGMADDSVNSAKKALGVQSPSKVFAEIGKAITDGLVQGVNKGSNSVVKSIENMLNKVQNRSKQSFKNITKSYDNAVSDIDKSLSKLPKVTDRVMSSLDRTLNRSANSQINIMRSITTSYSSEISKIDTTLSRLPQITESNMSKMGNTLKASANTQINALRSLTNDYKVEIDNINKNFNKLVSNTQVSMNNMTNRLRSGGSTQISYMRQLSVSLLTPFNPLPSQFNMIGRNAMDGLRSGLNARRSNVLATAAGIANSITSTMKQAFKIKSPSRVMRDEIGKPISEGIARGIEDNIPMTEMALEEMNKRILRGTENINNKAHRMTVNATRRANRKRMELNYEAYKQISKIHSLAADEERDLTVKEKAKIESIEKSHKDNVLKLRKQSAKEIELIESNKSRAINKMKEKSFRDTVDWIDRQTSYEEKSMYGQYQKWSKLQDDYVKKDKDISKKIKAQKNDVIAAEKLGNKKLVESRKKMLDKLLEQEKANDENLKEAQKEALDFKKQIHDELTSINEDYLSKVKSINDNLISEEKRLREEYQKTVDDRTDALYSFAGIFDEIKEKERVSGQDLINNLKGQVTAFDNWAKDISALSQRGIDEGLLEELREMGPKAGAEIAALNSLTDEELGRYNNLWRTKSQQAREQAEKELIGMKKDTEKQINDLHKQTDKQLDDLEKVWRIKIQNIRHGVNEEFDPLQSDLKGIGRNAIKGMIDGLSSMEGSLMAKANSIANAVKSTISSAFDIHSPSRWMRDEIGKNMMLGWTAGIDSEKSTVLRKTKEMSNWMSPSLAGVNGLRNIPIDFSSVGTNNSLMRSSNTDNSKTYGDTNITIVSPQNTPSENAREIKRVGRELSLGY